MDSIIDDVSTSNDVSKDKIEMIKPKPVPKTRANWNKGGNQLEN
jgi:hypothetical protein